MVEALLALPFGVLLALGWRAPRRPVGAPAPSPSKTIIWGLVAGAALGATSLQPTGLTTNQQFLSATGTTNTLVLTNGVIWAVE